MAKRINWSSSSNADVDGTDPPVASFGLFDTALSGAGMVPENEVPETNAAPNQIVFIEGSVADYQILANGVQPGVTVVILNPALNGVRQIADYLRQSGDRNLAAISIVADGSDGELGLGGTLLSASDIATYQPQLASIGAALKPGGDLLIYGCDVAQSSAGDAFLGDLAAATGVANIAAASHVVGAAADGGSFNLDVDLGSAAAATGPFTAATTAAYPDLLGVASNLVWYASNFDSTEDTGVYTIDVNGGAAATSPTDIKSTPAYAFGEINGFAIDPADGHYFVENEIGTVVSGNAEDVNKIVEGNTSGSGTPLVIYSSGNGGQDAIFGLAFDPLNGLLYMAVTDANIPGTNTDTGIYTINGLGTGTQTATERVILSSGSQAPTDIAIDTAHSLLFYTDGVPGLTNVEEVGVANLTTGAVINGDLVSYSASGNVEPYGIAVNPATDTLYWTTVDFSANSGNAIYSATYSTGGSVALSNTQTLATTSQAQAPVGIGLDVPAGGYYVDTSTGVADDTTANKVLFGSSLTTPETLATVYTVPLGDSETVETSAIVVDTQPIVTASGTVTYDGGGVAIAIDTGATVSDSDGFNLASATVSIASGLGAGDTLSFTNQLGITGTFSSGTLTLSGVTTGANYQTALDSVKFSTTGTSTTSRTIDWTVSDGVVTSPATTSTVDVHVPPVVTASGTVTFDGGGSPIELDSGLVVTDASSTTLAGATIVVAGSISADRLSFTNQNGISGTFSTTTGTLVLSGVASVANYQTALESITYSVSPSNSDPTGGGGDTTRTIHWSVNDGVANSGTVSSMLDTVHVAPAVTAGATVSYAGDGLDPPVVVDSGLRVTDPDSGGNLIRAAITISSGFTAGDALNFSAQNGIAESGFNNGTLTLTGTATVQQYQTALASITYSSSVTDPTVGETDTNRTIDWTVSDGVDTSNIAASMIDVTPCYCRGTRLLTDRGNVAVEDLRIGDRMVTLFGGARPVRWIGFRHLDLMRHPSPELAQPIRIRADAFADGVPCRDLLVSPDHAVLFDNQLVLARLLVNGASIVREAQCQHVTYYHVELETHDILVAEGLLAESYLDTGNRGTFANAADPLILHPDFGDALNLGDGQSERIARSCQPFASNAASVEPIWRYLTVRATMLGFCLPVEGETTTDPALRIVANGQVIKPVSIDGERYVFALPSLADAGMVRLVSRAVRPCESRPWLEDHRRLGVMVSRLALRYGPHVEPVPLDHPLMSRGWWNVERDHASLWRWTDGDASIPLPDARPAVLEVTLSGGLDYPVDQETGADMARSRDLAPAHWGATEFRRHLVA